MDTVRAPLCGRVREHLATKRARPTMLGALTHVEKFLTQRTSRDIAACAVSLIKDPGLSDEIVFAKIRDLVREAEAARGRAEKGNRLRQDSQNSQAPEGNVTQKKGRGLSRLRDVPRELLYVRWEAHKPDFAYLDIGCAEGQITEAVTRALGLPPERAHACDIVPQPPSSAFTFTACGEGLPYGDSSFDFVTMFMSAHHFADISAMFAETRRVLRPGGYLLIREHDCTSTARAFFYDIVHALYACVLSSEATPTEFVAQYSAGGYATYLTKEAWVEIARRHGFERHPEVPVHGPIDSRGMVVRDMFDSFYVFLRVRPGH